MVVVTWVSIGFKFMSIASERLRERGDVGSVRVAETSDCHLTTVTGGYYYHNNISFSGAFLCEIVISYSVFTV